MCLYNTQISITYVKVDWLDSLRINQQLRIIFETSRLLDLWNDVASIISFDSHYLFDYGNKFYCVLLIGSVTVLIYFSKKSTHIDWLMFGILDNPINTL